MKFLFLTLLFLAPLKANASTRPDIDTVTIIGLNPGLDGKMVGTYVTAKLDTLLWNQGIGIVKFSGSYLGSKGEFRIAYDKGFVSQISFVAPTRNDEETKNKYTQLTTELSNSYGPPDIETKDAIHEMRWEGLKQSISIKAIDGVQYVTIAISKF